MTNHKKVEPTIVTSWDSMPPEVYANGEIFSTRVLCKQHKDADCRVKLLEEQLFHVFHAEATGQGSTNEQAAEYARKRIKDL